MNDVKRLIRAVRVPVAHFAEPGAWRLRLTRSADSARLDSRPHIGYSGTLRRDRNRYLSAGATFVNGTPRSTTTRAASPSASLERLWERRDIALRERTLWRLLYETAARADEVLRLNVEDLDIPAKRARTRSKGRRRRLGCSSARAARGCCHA
jgi:integrase